MVRGWVSVGVLACAIGCGGDDDPANPGTGGRGGGGSGGTGGAPAAGGCQVVGREVRITDAPGASDMPRMAWDGQAYTVVWSDGRTGAGDIYAVRLDGSGSKLTEEKLVVSTGAPSRAPA